MFIGKISQNHMTSDAFHFSPLHPSHSWCTWPLVLRLSGPKQVRLMQECLEVWSNTAKNTRAAGVHPGYV